MKIIFFGLGSIGQRHARLLLDNTSHTLFAFRNKKVNGFQMPGVKEVYSWDEVERISADVAFITNPTSLHIDTAIKCARLGINLFIEKPVDCKTDRLRELLDLVARRRLVTYVAYCMRFHPVIEAINRFLRGKTGFHCNIIASSYLPEWRPSRDYRKVYSSHSEQGGGVILDLSHEIDYCQYLFGDILGMDGAYGKLSNLKINSEDYADIIMKFRMGIVNLHLNFFSKNRERRIRIDFVNSDYIMADLLANRLIINKKNKIKRYNFTLSRDEIYLKQINYFFKNINNRMMMNNLIDASRLFKTIINFKKKHEE